MKLETDDLDLVGEIRKRSFDTFQVPVETGGDKTKGRHVFYEITVQEPDADAVFQAIESAPKPFKMFGSRMEYESLSTCDLETDSSFDSDSSSDKDVNWKDGPPAASSTSLHDRETDL